MIPIKTIPANIIAVTTRILDSEHSQSLAQSLREFMSLTTIFIFFTSFLFLSILQTVFALVK